MSVVICDYCGKPAELVDSKIIYGRSYGNIWYCEKDQAWVGVHKNDNKNRPLGRLANEELRKWKIKAHNSFDKLWKDKSYKSNAERGKERRRCYELLGKRMGLSKSKTHIGLFTIPQCKEVVRICSSTKL